MIDLKQIKKEADAALLLYDLIGDGDWTPQDTAGCHMTQRVVTLIDEINRMKEVHNKEQRASADRLRKALENE